MAEITNSTPPQKSKLVAYFLWLIGGIFGLHHYYIGKDDQGFLWLTSFGGYFGCGWFRDFFKIPTYVGEVNQDKRYTEWFKYQVRQYPKVLKTHYKY